MDDLIVAGFYVLGAIGIVSLITLVVHEVRKGPGNRRTGLPAPRPDERSSIEQFKRIHHV